jgi:hypothetical protein
MPKISVEDQMVVDLAFSTRRSYLVEHAMKDIKAGRTDQAVFWTKLIEDLNDVAPKVFECMRLVREQENN